ncbi:hypothetical protein Drose_00390 [Dactylosporangium roseum]|uniref:Uncharacterized protein n=1 Tax=Dactylosporangium roseum TaxID=47989 RepID=A0ABY5Z482_9ACTN|nr:hypothetical protein [Dactylosporangium roseum]UWZ36846.1 hypothetical protein Drose_00390 [Dactylosporangium roseum]
MSFDVPEAIKRITKSELIDLTAKAWKLHLGAGRRNARRPACLGGDAFEPVPELSALFGVARGCWVNFAALYPDDHDFRRQVVPQPGLSIGLPRRPAEPRQCGRTAGSPRFHGPERRGDAVEAS